MRLGMTYVSRDFTADQAKVVMADYVSDLAEFTVFDVETAIREFRRDKKSEFFPKPGVLYNLSCVARRERIEREDYRRNKPEFRASRPHLWWMLPKEVWRQEWRESEVPAGEFIKDVRGGNLRQANAL